MSRETMFLLGIGAVIVAWKLTGKKASAPAKDYGPPLPADFNPDGTPKVLIYGPSSDLNMGPDYGPPNVPGFGIYQTANVPAGWVDPFASKVV